MTHHDYLPTFLMVPCAILDYLVEYYMYITCRSIDLLISLLKTTLNEKMQSTLLKGINS